MALPDFKFMHQTGAVTSTLNEAFPARGGDHVRISTGRIFTVNGLAPYDDWDEPMCYFPRAASVRLEAPAVCFDFQVDTQAAHLWLCSPDLREVVIVTSMSFPTFTEQPRFNGGAFRQFPCKQVMRDLMNAQADRYAFEVSDSAVQKVVALACAGHAGL